MAPTELITFVHNFIDLGGARRAFRLSGQTPPIIADPANPNIAVSHGSFVGHDNLKPIAWTAESSISPGSHTMETHYIFEAEVPIGPMRFIQYLERDRASNTSDILFLPLGSVDNDNLTLATLQDLNLEVSQGGEYVPGLLLQGAFFAGWGADTPDFLEVGQGDDVAVSPTGINKLPSFQHPLFGQVFGPEHDAIASVLAWDVDDNAKRVQITARFSVGAREPPPLVIHNPDKAVCTDVRCTISVSCSATEITSCIDQAVIVVNKSSKKGEVKVSRAGTQVRMAAGVSNIPPGATGRIKLKLTRVGKKIAALFKGRKIKGIMAISNADRDQFSSTPIRLRIK